MTRLLAPEEARDGHAANHARSGPGLWTARAAFLVGLGYAAVSIYWGAGGTWLLDTVGGSLVRIGRSHTASVMIAVSAAPILKLTAAILPLAAVRDLRTPTINRTARALAWIAAAVLTAYGTILTAVGLLVQTEVIHTSARADHKALEWHAYLWDPWFLLWGLLTATAMLRSRAPRPGTSTLFATWCARPRRHRGPPQGCHWSVTPKGGVGR